MPSPRRRPWAECVLDLLGSIRLLQRERRVLVAMVESSDRRGRCLLGDVRLGVAARVDRAALHRTLYWLGVRGIVSRDWFRTGTGFWVRVLRVRRDALEAAVRDGGLLGRAWDSRRDAVPFAVADRTARRACGPVMRRVRALERRARGEDLPGVEPRCVSRPSE